MDRVNVGGKLLTNYLKELVSFRQWYMMEDTYIINAAKESCCYVSLDFEKDQDICKSVLFLLLLPWKYSQRFLARLETKTNDIVRNYVLPDYSSTSTNRKGYVQSDAQAEVAAPILRSPERGKQKGGFAPANKVDQGEDQVLKLSNERFIVPELLFQPGMIGKLLL